MTDENNKLPANDLVGDFKKVPSNLILKKDSDPVGVSFIPRPDITTFELARLLPFISPGTKMRFIKGSVNKIPFELKRHLFFPEIESPSPFQKAMLQGKGIDEALKAEKASGAVVSETPAHAGETQEDPA